MSTNRHETSRRLVMRLYGSVSGDLSEDRGDEKKQKMRCFFVGDAILSYTIQLYRDCFMKPWNIDPYKPTIGFAWKVIERFLCVCVCARFKWLVNASQAWTKNSWCLEFGASLGSLWMWDLCGCEKWMLQLRFSFSMIFRVQWFSEFVSEFHVPSVLNDLSQWCNGSWLPT